MVIPYLVPTPLDLEKIPVRLMENTNDLSHPRARTVFVNFEPYELKENESHGVRY